MLKKYMNFFVALLVALVLISTFHFFLNTRVSATVERILFLLGGDIKNGGYIQFLTYVAFIWGMLEIYGNNRKMDYQTQGLYLDLLPTTNLYVLSPPDINQKKLEMDRYEQELRAQDKPGLLIADLIRKACVNFDNNRIVSEVTSIVVNQVRIYRQMSENGQSFIGYLAWVIPSVGFIGTVIGISNALGIADTADTSEVTRTLGVAFDTTLVSLLLSVVLMYFFHRMQVREDDFHSKMEEYVIENLINRIVLK